MVVQRPENLDSVEADAIIRGIPRSGTTALGDYLENDTSLTVHNIGKHRPLYAYDDEKDGKRIHILKHPAPWLVSYADWLGLEEENSVKSWPWTLERLHDWALRNRCFQDDATITVTHWEMITDLEGMLQRIVDCFEDAHLLHPVALRGEHANKDEGFYKTKYTEFEYLDHFGYDAYERLVGFLHSRWGKGVRDELGLGNEYWSALVVGEDFED